MPLGNLPEASIGPNALEMAHAEAEEEEDYRMRQKRAKWAFWGFMVGWGIVLTITLIYWGIWVTLGTGLGIIVGLPLMWYFIRVPKRLIVAPEIRNNEVALFHMVEVAAGAINRIRMTGNNPFPLETPDGTRVVIANKITRPSEGKMLVECSSGYKTAWLRAFTDLQFVPEITAGYELLSRENTYLKSTMGYQINNAVLARAGQEFARAEDMPEDTTVGAVSMKVWDASQSETKSDRQLAEEKAIREKENEPKDTKRTFWKRPRD